MAKATVDRVSLPDAVRALDILDELLLEHADAIGAAGGDIEAVPEIAQLLAFGEAQFHEAVERWAYKIQLLEAEGKMHSEIAAHHEGRANVKNNGAKRLKEYLTRMLTIRDLERVQTPTFVVRLQNNSRPSFKAISDTALEELLLSGSELVSEDIKRTVKLNDKALIAAWEQNAVPSEIVATLGKHLRIG
jgi:hypothetical protein